MIRRLRSAHHFDVAPDGGLWRVTARDGLIGGIFRSEKDALRFALDEACGERGCVHRFGAHRSRGSAAGVRR